MDASQINVALATPWGGLQVALLLNLVSYQLWRLDRQQPASKIRGKICDQMTVWQLQLDAMLTQKARG